MMTTMKKVLGLVAILALCACKSHEGVYLPDCIAYEGDRVHFAAGRYRWERFTDAIVIGDDGEPVDPFPGYPRQGTYRVDGENVYMTADNGIPVEQMYLHVINDRYHLLTEDQDYARHAGDELAKCLLVLQQED